MTTRKDIEKIISEIENGDDNIALFERAMNHYCSNWDICDGYKHALLQTLADQWDNHEEDQEPDSLNELSDILNGAI